MKKCIFLILMAVLSLSASAEYANVKAERSSISEIGRKYYESTVSGANAGKSPLFKARKAPSLNAAPADIAGKYVFASFNREEINTSGLITITKGSAAGTYQVAGLHGSQTIPVTGTYANGQLTIAAGQLGMNSSTYGNVVLYQMSDNTYYNTNDIVLEFDENGMVELTSGVGFLMLINSGEYQGYSIGSTLNNGYYAYAVNGKITSHMVKSDFTDDNPSSESYPTFTGFYQDNGVQYALVAGIDDMTFFTIQINEDNTVNVIQAPSYYYSQAYNVAYPCKGVRNSTTGAFNFYPSQGPTGVIDWEAGTITLDMWGFYMESAETASSYANLNGRKAQSVITFTDAEPEIPASTEFNCTTTPRSKYLEGNKVNSYKNSLAMRLKVNASTLVGKTRTIYRTNKATGEKTRICTVRFTSSTKGKTTTYTYTISNLLPMAATASTALRYDTQAYTTTGTIATTSSTNYTMTVNDYFTASTAEGGDNAGAYVYTVEDGTTAGKLGQADVYTANIVTYVSAADGTDGYYFDEIQGDTDHALSAQGRYSIDIENVSDGVSGVEFYYDHQSAGSDDEFDPEYASYYITDDIVTSTTFSVALKVGTNTYGTNESTCYAAVLGDFNAYNKVKSDATFNNGSRFFTCLLSAALNTAQDGLFETTGGGYRVWRTCETSDENNEELNGRASDFLFFDNVGLDGSSLAIQDVGGEIVSVGNSSFQSGMFGSSTETPTAIMRVRAYYKSMSAANRVMAKADENSLYSIAESIFEVSFNENVVTGLKEVTGVKEISDINFYNAAGQMSKNPHKGINIVVTTYQDGTTSTRKQIVK